MQQNFKLICRLESIIINIQSAVHEPCP